MTDDEIADWIENANDGQGPTPTASVHRADMEALLAAVRQRDQAELSLSRAVSSAHANGASWAAIGASLGMTRQGAHKKYARAHSDNDHTHSGLAAH